MRDLRKKKLKRVVTQMLCCAVGNVFIVIFGVS